MRPLEADAIIACLHRHDVRYVLIGGLAAILHGSPQVTFDADICPQRDPKNLENLAAALRDMSARVRAPDVPEGLVFGCDAAFLSSVQILNLVTAHGELDLSFQPSGTAGYADLVQNAQAISIGGHIAKVAALEDVIRSKEAAGRPKDRAALPLLRQLLEQIGRQEPPKPE
jgi:hypothetical protein